MATRCASCSYPLSVSDSVACYECSSYFHIDCAQLVGFPHYELSSDPNRNTFLCTTCVLLPLPTRGCDSDSDSSSSDCDMPSRQQDYALEAQADIAKDMNEVKGAVQDLSNLCKDMLREINEIKSINLTLRCGIENLRHENEERNKVITDLKRRICNLESSKGTIDNKTVNSILCDNILEHSTEESIDLDVTSINDKYIATEQTTQKQTVTFEETTCQDHEEEIKNEVNRFESNESKEDRQDWTWKGRKAVELKGSAEESVDEGGITEGSEIEEEIAHGWETLQEELESEYKVKEEVVCTSLSDTFERSNVYSNEEILHSEYETEDESVVEHTEEKNKCSKKEDNILDRNVESVFKTSDEITEDEDEEEEEEKHERKEHGLENMNTFQQDERGENTTTSRSEEISYEIIPRVQAYSTESCSNYMEDKFLESGEELNEDEDEAVSTNESKSTEHLQVKTETPLLESCEKEEEDITEDETSSTLEDIHHEDFIEVEVGEIPEEGDNEESIVAGEDKEETEKTEVGEDGYRSELDIDNKEVCDEEEEGGSHLNGEQILEERADGDERLGESCLDVPEEETGVEGTQRLGGQSPEDGEVQPSEPPTTPPPQHTEEDLWHYLKEAVTSERPSTVEEFLQNLIGTLQHVPEEYLQPVIEANIKRANSPTLSTDGEPLRTLEDPMEKQEAMPVEGSKVSEGEAVPDTTAIVEEASQETPSQLTEVTGDVDGYSAVEVVV